jgi:hypothetical protein
VGPWPSTTTDVAVPCSAGTQFAACEAGNHGVHEVSAFSVAESGEVEFCECKGFALVGGLLAWKQIKVERVRGEVEVEGG